MEVYIEFLSVIRTYLKESWSIKGQIFYNLRTSTPSTSVYKNITRLKIAKEN